ncbi:hypothetical protein ABZV91_29870 [Nocardia sp. NPDC004568]|uniref:hypothetical protein n=1 Tax=Nocardia sp. NPDC004568 TaxID=3154551 RepID=UPI0033BC9FB8
MQIILACHTDVQEEKTWKKQQRDYRCPSHDQQGNIFFNPPPEFPPPREDRAIGRISAYERNGRATP